MKKNFLIILASGAVIIISFVLLNFHSADKSGRIVAVGELYSSLKSGDLSGSVNSLEKTAYFDGGVVNIPEDVFDIKASKVLGVANEERWIEVDLSEQRLKAWDGAKLFLETLVSTGLPWYPTPTGEFRIWIKLRATKMEGGNGKHYYYLPNVPYVMYFQNSDVPGWRGYGLHGTYWHNDFGTQRSHGCVNLPTEIAKELYYWTSPVLPEGKSTVYADEGNLGTKIVIHE